MSNGLLGVTNIEYEKKEGEDWGGRVLRRVVVVGSIIWRDLVSL